MLSQEKYLIPIVFLSMNMLYDADSVRQWDAYTMQHEPISSLDLMERAASRAAQWMMKQWPDRITSFEVYCGTGNNGGDGLVIARQLLQNRYTVRVFAERYGEGSPDRQTNMNRLLQSFPDVIYDFSEMPVTSTETIIIDALFGSGLNRPLEGKMGDIIQLLNSRSNSKVSIDIPSGLCMDRIMDQSPCIQADYTVSFEHWKPCFLWPESGRNCGQVILIPIGLHPGFVSSKPVYRLLNDQNSLLNFYKPRQAFSHKGDYGHVALWAGTSGKMGAALMAAEGALRAGAGLVTVFVPEAMMAIVQTAIPEAMVVAVEENLPDNTNYNAVALGCGLGTLPSQARRLEHWLRQIKKPLIIDADALNIIAGIPDGVSLIPRGSALTPHPKEFTRLFGEDENTCVRQERMRVLSEQLGIYILLKGRYSCLSTPEGLLYYNLNGNPGMAKGGSGDVLTGIISGLYAVYQDMEIAARMGMYLHGEAGDLAAADMGVESMMARDILQNLGNAFKTLYPELR